MKGLFKWLLLVPVLLILFSVSVSASEVNVGGSDGAQGAGSYADGASYIRTGYLCYVSDDTGKSVTDIIYVPWNGVLPQSKVGATMDITGLSTRFGETFNKVLLTHTPWGFPVFNEDASSNYARLRQWLLNPYGQSGSGTEWLLESYFNYDAEQCQEFLGGDFYLNIEGVLTCGVFEGSVYKEPKTFYFATSKNWASRTDNRTAMSGYTHKNLPNSLYYVKDWLNLTAPTDVTNKHDSNTLTSNIGYGIMSIRGSDLFENTDKKIVKCFYDENGDYERTTINPCSNTPVLGSTGYRVIEWRITNQELPFSVTTSSNYDDALTGIIHTQLGNSDTSVTLGDSEKTVFVKLVKETEQDIINDDNLQAYELNYIYPDMSALRYGSYSFDKVPLLQLSLTANSQQVEDTDTIGDIKNSQWNSIDATYAASYKNAYVSDFQLTEESALGSSAFKFGSLNNQNLYSDAIGGWGRVSSMGGTDINLGASGSGFPFNADGKLISASDAGEDTLYGFRPSYAYSLSRGLWENLCLVPYRTENTSSIVSEAKLSGAVEKLEDASYIEGTANTEITIGGKTTKPTYEVTAHNTYDEYVIETCWADDEDTSTICDYHTEHTSTCAYNDTEECDCDYTHNATCPEHLGTGGCNCNDGHESDCVSKQRGTCDCSPNVHTENCPANPHWKTQEVERSAEQSYEISHSVNKFTPMDTSTSDIPKEGNNFTVGDLNFARHQADVKISVYPEVEMWLYQENIVGNYSITNTSSTAPSVTQKSAYVFGEKVREWYPSAVSGYRIRGKNQISGVSSLPSALVSEKAYEMLQSFDAKDWSGDKSSGILAAGQTFETGVTENIAIDYITMSIEPKIDLEDDEGDAGEVIQSWGENSKVAEYFSDNHMTSATAFADSLVSKMQMEIFRSQSKKAVPISDLYTLLSSEARYKLVSKDNKYVDIIFKEGEIVNKSEIFDAIAGSYNIDTLEAMQVYYEWGFEDRLKDMFVSRTDSNNASCLRPDNKKWYDEETTALQLVIRKAYIDLQDVVADDKIDFNMLNISPTSRFRNNEEAYGVRFLLSYSSNALIALGNGYEYQLPEIILDDTYIKNSHFLIINKTTADFRR